MAVTTAVFWKHEQALLILGVENLLTKLGATAGAPASNPGQNASASTENASRARRTSSSKQIVGRGEGVPVEVIVGTAVFWKHEQALLILGVENLLTKLGATAGAPASNPGQNARASTEKASSARRTSSSKQIVGRGDGVGVVPAVFWKQEQALLTLGVAKLLTKVGKTTGMPASTPGHNALASTANASSARRTSSSKQMVERGEGGLVGLLVGTAVFWKQEQALLIVGVEKLLT